MEALTNRGRFHGHVKNIKTKMDVFALNIDIVQRRFLCKVAIDVKKVVMSISITDTSPMSLFLCTVVGA
jgi:hypothetical protein